MYVCMVGKDAAVSKNIILHDQGKAREERR